MTLAISIIAIFISMISLVFSFHQYKSNQLIKKLEKSNEVLRQSHELRKTSQDIRNKVNATDDIDDYNPLLDQIDKSLEKQLLLFFSITEIQISDIYKMESTLLSIDLDLELLIKQINEAIRFNKEATEFDNQ